MTGNMARERYKPKAADCSLCKRASAFAFGLGERISYYLIAILVFQLYMLNIFTGAGTRSIGSAT